MINKINNEVIKMPNTGIVKYHVKLKFDVDGLVEKADIIGAIFGQTEGLLGPEMNLNELQKVSKVGRIEVNVDTKSNSARGDALIPMSTDISTAALIAAAIESIDKVGPFQAKFSLVGIDDIRAIKKKVIVDRAKKIVQEWATKTISEGEEMLKDVYDASKPGRLTTFGKAQLACGVGVFDSDWIILVEGRADVINLLRAGYDNSIAIEGAKIDETILKLTQGKRTIAFIDGDRAGDLILKELQGLVDIEKVYRAPPGREVEECTPLEISEILKDVEQFINDKINDTNTIPSNVQQIRNHHRIDHSQNQSNNQDQNSSITYNRNLTNQSLNKHNNYDNSDQKQSPDNMISKEDEEVISIVKKVFQEINETLEAMVFDKSMKRIVKIPISEIMKKISELKDGNLLILDGIVTPRLVEAANKSGIRYIIGHRTSNLKRTNPDVRVQTFSDMGLISQPISSR
ncbi:DNA primase [Candidatus Nitrosocosmicus oleophilus]|jgi:DNA primase|uniref:DNA primase DnaG n=2 Tax=Candidatus Nitrosocosmicus oleophilus TaxID=1353260 RepID=A0A654M0A9_9ARCH|nr:DNA primase DnaG [Candidatus Nitrosocosmicus oleophilus]ALI36410.1 DNA primase [Candidatus Nitrosocosmicus oleophilus]